MAFKGKFAKHLSHCDAPALFRGHAKNADWFWRRLPRRPDMNAIPEKRRDTTVAFYLLAYMKTAGNQRTATLGYCDAICRCACGVHSDYTRSSG